MPKSRRTDTSIDDASVVGESVPERKLWATAAWVDERPVEPMSVENRDLVLLGLEAARSGDLATPDEVREIFDRYRL